MLKRFNHSPTASKAGPLRSERLPALCLFVFSLACLSTFSIKVPTNGDTFVYSHSIVSLKGPEFHIGYYVIGSFFQMALGRAGMSPLGTLTLLSILSGAVCVVTMYLLSKELTGDPLLAALSSLVLLFSGSFWLFAVHGEVYVPQLALVFLSILAVIWSWPLVSGLFLLAAVSITPTSLLALPGLLCLMVMRGFSVKQMVWFAAPFLAALIVVLVAGPLRVARILGSAVYLPADFVHPFSYSALFSRVFFDVARAYGKSFHLASLFAIIGFVLLWRRERALFLLLLCFIIPFAAYFLNLGLFSADHLIISFIPLSLLAAYGLLSFFRSIKLSRRATISAAITTVALYSFISYQLFIGPQTRDSKEQLRVIGILSSNFGEDAVMISNYSFGTAFWSLTQPEESYHLLTGRPGFFLRDECPDRDLCIRRLNAGFWLNLTHLPAALSSDKRFGEYLLTRTVFLVDCVPWHSWLVQRFMPGQLKESDHSGMDIVHRLSQYVSTSLGHRVECSKIIDSPLYPVYRLVFSS